MFNITLKRPLVTLAVTAGLLVAAAGPASASQTGPLIAPPHTETISVTDYIILLDGVQGGSGSTGNTKTDDDCNAVAFFDIPAESGTCDDQRLLQRPQDRARDASAEPHLRRRPAQLVNSPLVARDACAAARTPASSSRAGLRERVLRAAESIDRSR